MMERRAAVVIAGLLGVSLALGAGMACGSRTGLPEDAIADAAPEHGLFNPDRFVEEPIPDHREEDVIEEAPPGIDTNRPDVPVINPCPDAAATLIYVIGTKSNTLYSFDPTSQAFATVGVIECPGSSGNPFSMAVDRQGVAYVAFAKASGVTNQEIGTGLFRVSTKTASCKPTKYDPAKWGNPTFGMGFVADVSDAGVGEGGAADASSPGETLFISQNNGTADGELFSLDTTTFDRHTIGLYAPTVQEAELTGTGLGQLFAFQPWIQSGADMTSGAFIYEVEGKTAKVLGTDPIVVGGGYLQAGNGWAFAFWGGSFYMFTGTGPQGSTQVNKFDPATKTIVPWGSLTTDTVVGAGVSTCAPQGG